MVLYNLDDSSVQRSEANIRQELQAERRHILERTAVCLLKGRERIQMCRNEFLCVWQMVEEALPLLPSNALPAEEDPVSRAIEDIRTIGDLLACVWDEKNESLMELCTRCPDWTALPIPADMDEAEIETMWREQQEITRLLSNRMLNLEGCAKAFGQLLGDYEKALTVRLRSIAIIPLRIGNCGPL